MACLILTIGCGGGGTSSTTSSTASTGSTSGSGGTLITASKGGTVVSGNATVVIPANALAQNTQIGIQSPTGSLAAAPSGFQILGGTSYDLEPTGTQFSIPATLTIHYSTASIPTGVPETSLNVYTEVSGAWQVVDGATIDTAGHAISVPLAHFSVYAVLSPQYVGNGPVYNVTDLGVIPGDASSNPSGISSNGQVCGTSTYVDAKGNGTLHAFLWANGTMTNLGTRPGDTQAKANAVNASGAAVGISLPNTSNAFPVEFAGGAVTQLNTQYGLVGGNATAINDSGEIVVGNALNVGGSVTAFPSGFTASTASGALNTSAIVAGSTGNDAAIWNAGTVIDEGILPGYDVAAGTAVSDNGILVGTANVASSSKPVGFYFQSGTYSKISPIPGGTTPDDIAEPAGVNTSGQVVGVSSLDFITARAFIYQSGVTQDLNTLVPTNTGWTLRQAVGINNSGQIAVLGVSASGSEHALLLTPKSAALAHVKPLAVRRP